MARELVSLARTLAAGGDIVRRITPDLARARFSAKALFLDDIAHHVYGGDTLLHVAAAAYATKVARALVEAGADLRARNRRGAEPLHYAADGNPELPTWDPKAQAVIVAYLIDAGADPDALDKSVRLLRDASDQ